MNGKGVLQLLFVSAAWSVYYVATQYMNSRVSMFAAGTVVRVITLALFLVYLACRGELGRLRTSPKVRPRLILIGVLCFLLDAAAFLGFAHSPAGVGTALLKLDIVFVNLISIVVYGKKPSLLNWFFTSFMLFGVLVLIGVDLTGFTISDPALLLFPLSAFTVSCNAFLVQSTQRNYPETDDMAIIFYNLLFSGICFTVAALASGAFSASAALFSEPICVAALVGGVSDALLFVLYYKSLRQFSVWLVKIVLLTMPAISAVISFAVFGEALVPRQLLGIALICLGALLILRNESDLRKRAASGHNG